MRAISKLGSCSVTDSRIVNEASSISSDSRAYISSDVTVSKRLTHSKSNKEDAPSKWLRPASDRESESLSICPSNKRHACEISRGVKRRRHIDSIRNIVTEDSSAESNSTGFTSCRNSAVVPFTVVTKRYRFLAPVSRHSTSRLSERTLLFRVAKILLLSLGIT